MTVQISQGFSTASEWIVFRHDPGSVYVLVLVLINLPIGMIYPTLVYTTSPHGPSNT